MEPDKSKKRIRFGCGFAFGLIVGFFTTARHIYNSAGGIAAGTFVTAFVFGLLALKYGDSFWEILRKWYWWW